MYKVSQEADVDEDKEETDEKTLKAFSVPRDLAPRDRQRDDCVLYFAWQVEIEIGDSSEKKDIPRIALKRRIVVRCVLCCLSYC